MDELLLRPRKAAEVLGVCEKTLYTLTKRGEIPVVRLGERLKLYSVDELRHWIAARSTREGDS